MKVVVVKVVVKVNLRSLQGKERYLKGFVNKRGPLICTKKDKKKKKKEEHHEPIEVDHIGIHNSVLSKLSQRGHCLN